MVSQNQVSPLLSFDKLIACETPGQTDSSQDTRFRGTIQIFHPILMGIFSLYSSQRKLSVVFQHIFYIFSVFKIKDPKGAKNAILWGT